MVVSYEHRPGMSMKNMPRPTRKRLIDLRRICDTICQEMRTGIRVRTQAAASLPDAEIREHLAQKIVGRDRPGDGPELIQRFAKLERE